MGKKLTKLINRVDPLGIFKPPRIDISIYNFKKKGVPLYKQFQLSLSKELTQEEVKSVKEIIKYSLDAKTARENVGKYFFSISWIRQVKKEKNKKIEVIENYEVLEKILDDEIKKNSFYIPFVKIWESKILQVKIGHRKEYYNNVFITENVDLKKISYERFNNNVKAYRHNNKKKLQALRSKG